MSKLMDQPIINCARSQGFTRWLHYWGGIPIAVNTTRLDCALARNGDFCFDQVCSSDRCLAWTFDGGCVMTKPAVVLIGADKGGVGKTTVARTLLDYFAERRVRARAFDTEVPKGTLKRFYPDLVDVVDINYVPHQMRIFDTVNSTDASVSLIDVSAGLLSPTLHALRNIGFTEAAKKGHITFRPTRLISKGYLTQSRSRYRSSLKWRPNRWIWPPFHSRPSSLTRRRVGTLPLILLSFGVMSVTGWRPSGLSMTAFV